MISVRVRMSAEEPRPARSLIYHSPVPETAADSTKLVVVGQGYVGLPLAVRAVEQGFDVVGFDVDGSKIKRLEAGESTVEDVGDDRLRAALGDRPLPPDIVGRRLHGLRRRRHLGADSPSRRQSGPQLHRAGGPRPRAAPPGRRAPWSSSRRPTPGPPRSWSRPILEDGSGLLVGRDFHLGYSPERIDPGNPQWRLENTPKVVSGVDAASLAAVQGFYDRIVETTVAVSTPKEAELTKLLENTFRHVNIALVNELAMFANDLGIDVWEAIDAASTKPFGYMRFTPGPGVGGHCLPIDPSYLSWRVRQLARPGLPLRRAGQRRQRSHARLRRPPSGRSRLNQRRLAVNGRRILLLGLSYKRNTGDARESPSQPIARQLLQLGAHVLAADPFVDASRVPSRRRTRRPRRREPAVRPTR